MCVVRLERVEERIARGHGREGEGRGDQGLRRHGSVAVWQRDRWLLLLLLLAWCCEETGEDGQLARDVGAVEIVCWVWLLKKNSSATAHKPKKEKVEREGERIDVRGARGGREDDQSEIAMTLM